jgi:release factor glutamine methyltransferase
VKLQRLQQRLTTIESLIESFMSQKAIEEFLKSMEALGLQHESPWVLEELKRLALAPSDSELYLADLLKRRAQGEPLAYIFGHWAFRSLEFFVGPGVLIPRPETEELVELVLAKLRQKSKSFSQLKIVDAGAGSGCLGLGLWYEIAILPEFQSVPRKLTLIENSPEAIPFLKKNVEHLKAQNESEVFEGSWNVWRPEGQIQVLVSNPPYIRGVPDDDADAEVKLFEPHAALYPTDLNRFGDASGPYRELIRLAQWTVEVGGLAAFELGASQAAWIASFVEENYPDWRGQLLKDMSGKDRFWIMERIR